MRQVETWVANPSHFFGKSGDKAAGNFRGRSIQQLGRGSALLSAVVGSTFFGLASAAKPLGEREVRRVGVAPQAIAKLPTQSVFPDTHFSLIIPPRDYFLDTDSAGFKIEVVEKGEQSLPSWLNSDIQEMYFLGASGAPDNARAVDIVGNFAYVADKDLGLLIIDVSNPSAPFLVGSYNTPDNAWGVDIAGNFAYVADDKSGLQIIDVSNPSAPVRVGSYNTPGNAFEVTVVDNLAYVADYDSGLQIIDVSNPSAPNRVGSYNIPDTAYGVDVVGNFAYVASLSFGLAIINVSSPSNPTLAASCDTPGSVAFRVDVVGNFAYVASAYSGFAIIDVSNPSSPFLTGSYNTPGYASGVDIMGNFAYVADGSSIVIIDISSPYTPTLAGSYDTPDSAQGVDVIGNFVYVADDESGLQILEHDLLLSGTPSAADIGNYELELIAEDPDQNRASSTFFVRVEGPPVVAGIISDKLTNVGDSFSYFIDQAVFPDPNNDVVYYTAKITDQTALPVWLSFSPIGIFSGTPQSSDVGTYDIEVEAHDGIVLAQANTTFSLTVDHFPKVATPLSDQAANIDHPYSFTVPEQTFTDEDAGDTLTYSSSPLPPWLSFIPSTQTFSGTPAALDAGAYPITVIATDTPGAAASTTFTLAVGEFPILQNPISDQLAAISVPYLYSLPGNTFTTPPGEFLFYRATKADGSYLPAWLGFVGPRLEFQGTPQPSDKGNVHLKVVAEDSKGGTAESIFGLNVVDALSQENARIGSSFVYQIPDMISSPLDSVIYTATLGDGSPLPSWLHHNPATNILTGNPPRDSEGDYNILIRADDSVQEPVEGILFLNVGVNAGPKVANPISNQIAQVGQTYRLVIPDDTFVDPNEDDLTLSAKRASGRTLPTWLTLTDRVLEGKPGPSHTGAFSDKTYPLQICATDSDLEACSVFDLSVQGTSNAERALSIFGPVVAFGGLAYGWFNKRGVILNPWNRKNFDKGTRAVAIGETFNYKFGAPQDKITGIKTYKGQRMYFGLPAPRTLDEKGWLNWLKQNKPIAGGGSLPMWLQYDLGENQLVNHSGPNEKDAGLYTIQVFGHGEVILEEIRLNVGNQSEDGIELTTRRKGTTKDPSSGMVPLLDDDSTA